MELDARIETLEAELAELRRLARRPAVPPASPTSASGSAPGPGAGDRSRRHLLGRAAAVALGVAAGSVATATPAAADDPNDVTLGATKTAGGLTAANYTGSAEGAAFLFQHGNEFTPGQSGVNAALAGWAAGGAGVSGPLAGVYAYTNVASSSALHALNATSSGEAATIEHAGSGPALRAASDAGPVLVLDAGGGAPTMPPATGDWLAGSVMRSADGHLWYCTMGGSGIASTWVRLSGGGINLLATPQRALDTRPGMGPFEGDDTRTVSLRSWGVPAGATGALLNLTVTDTTGYGYLQAYSAALAAPPATSNLNWYPGARIVANSATVAVNAAGEIKLTSQRGTAQVLVDVAGYID